MPYTAFLYLLRYEGVFVRGESVVGQDLSDRKFKVIETARGFSIRREPLIREDYLVKIGNLSHKFEAIEYAVIKSLNTKEDTLINLRDSKYIMRKACFSISTQVQNELSEIGLLLFNKEKVLLYTFKAIAISLIIGLSFYRINYALAHGHHNIFFLIILTIIFTVFIIKFFKISTISPHGKLLIKSFQKNYEKEKDENFTELLTNKQFNFSKNVYIDKSIFLFSIFGLNSIPLTLWEFDFLGILNPKRTIDNLSSNYSDWSTSNNSSGCSSSGCSSSDSSSSDSGSSCGSGCGGCGGGGD